MAGVEVHEPALLLRAPPEPFQEQAVSQVAVAFIAGRIAGDARPADAKVHPAAGGNHFGSRSRLSVGRHRNQRGGKNHKSVDFAHDGPPTERTCCPRDDWTRGWRSGRSHTTGRTHGRSWPRAPSRRSCSDGVSLHDTAGRAQAASTPACDRWPNRADRDTWCSLHATARVPTGTARACRRGTRCKSRRRNRPCGAT